MPDLNTPPLGQFNVEDFLRDYWQKKPLLIRNTWPGFEPLLASDELAGLSLEAEIESRIVMEEGPAGPWDILKGPFTESDYAKLPEEKWTLLIQAVDQWIPEAAELLQAFNFIPGWRIDDLMISYATHGGSVGPHYDQYDVFLLQAEGQREWRIGQRCSEHSPILDGPKLRILEQFAETDRWVLNPGDMLYLPPLWAHWGVAQGECQTYSIGFRAPSLNELGQSLIDQMLETVSEDDRYSDPDLAPDEANGEIHSAALTRLRQLLTQQLLSDAMLSDTLGKLMTESKYPELQAEPLSEEEWPQDWGTQAFDLAQLPGFYRAGHARFAFADLHTGGSSSNTDSSSSGPSSTASSNGSSIGGLLFYAQGESWPLEASDRALAEWLCDERDYSPEALADIRCSESGFRLIKALWLKQLLIEADLDEHDEG